MRGMLSIALAAGIAMASPSGHAAPVTFKSVSVDLPTGDRMFEGAGADAANNNCLACHSVGMVLNQPALSKAQWQAEVEKMRTAYKAPIEPQDVAPIVDYLVGIRGTK